MAGSVDILLVEDNPNDAFLALHALKAGNITHSVQVARDGVEALEYLFATGTFEGRNIEEAPKVIFLDLKLPRVDGLEVLRRIKEDSGTAVIPVVILTSSAQERDLEECYRLGANSYVVKPVNFDQFNDAVQRMGTYWLHLNQLPG